MKLVAMKTSNGYYALVAGGSKGIGYSIAEALASRKYNLVLIARNWDGGSKDYLTAPLDTMRYMVRLNIESCMALSQTLLPLLEKNAPSYILNVASLAGLTPIPIKNMYSATKAAVIYFSYALHYQLREKNISVSCLAPGPVYTKPEIEKETRKQLGSIGDKIAVSVKKVGEIAIRKTMRGKVLIIPGFLPKLMASFLRILPRKTATAIYFKLGKK